LVVMKIDHFLPGLTGLAASSSAALTAANSSRFLRI